MSTWLGFVVQADVSFPSSNIDSLPRVQERKVSFSRLGGLHTALQCSQTIRGLLEP